MGETRDTEPAIQGKQNIEDDVHDSAAHQVADPMSGHPIDFWARQGHWPREYSEVDMQRSNSASSATPSDQRPREEKSAPYQDPFCEYILMTKKVFMTKSILGISAESKTLCSSLLEKNQPVPDNSLFGEDMFETTCQAVDDGNEERVIRDISRLIVPSAETLATLGATHLKALLESFNERWNNSVPLIWMHPQPDYSVGLRREAFTNEQLAKLSSFNSSSFAGDLSLFMATHYIYFPFLACEVKCALDIADRQNAYTMALAARGVVELFRLVKREEELDRQILSFSISHNHSLVRIYGCYPVIDGNNTRYYCHPIHAFDFTALHGKEKWTAYRFTKNIYDIWMPEHFKRICSAIDQLPTDTDCNVPPLFESTGLSQDLEG